LAAIELEHFSLSYGALGKQRTLVDGITLDNLRLKIHYPRRSTPTTGQVVSDPAKLIVPMIERFMATDRAFAKARRGIVAQTAPGAAERSG
jgi:Protein of unknown function (DUF2274)